jgi:hypothetical protein
VVVIAETVMVVLIGHCTGGDGEEERRRGGEEKGERRPPLLKVSLFCFFDFDFTSPGRVSERK